MSPITLGVQVTEVDAFLLAEVDVGDGTGDFAGDESLTTARGFVVEEDTVARKHVVGFAVVDDDPVPVELGDTVRRARVEGSCFLLRGLDDLAVEFRGRGLVELDAVGEAAGADGVEETESADGVDLGGAVGKKHKMEVEWSAEPTSVFGRPVLANPLFSHVERDLDVRLGSQVVDL